MNMQKIYIWRSEGQMHDFHKQILGLVSADVLAKSHSITWSCILGVFSCKFLQYFEWLFFRTISYKFVSLSLIEKNIP